VHWSAASKGTAVASLLVPPPRVGVDRDPQDPHGPEVNDSGDRICACDLRNGCNVLQHCASSPASRGEDIYLGTRIVAR